MRRVLRWLTLAAALGLVPSGCDDGASAPAGSGRGPFSGRGPGGPASEAPIVEPAPPSDAPRGRSARSSARPFEPSAPLAGGSADPAPSTGAPGGPTGPGDDPAVDALRRAFGTPTQCIAPETRARLQTRLSIRVHAAVMGSGRVTRANVSAGELSPADLECMRRHAESLSLGIPVENAPRTVTAVVQYDVRSTPDVETEVEPEVARIPGQVAPDRTLPAIADGPPPGQAAPGITLEPGGTVTQRPRGFVPPSSTLPAQVP